MTSPTDAVLVAPGMVTRRRGEQEPFEIPLVEARSYDRFARELGDALGVPVRLADALDADAGVLLVPAGATGELPEALAARTLLLDASQSDQVHVVRGRLLGAVMEDALESWRRGEPRVSDGLFGLKDVVERMSGPVSTRRDRFGYTTIDADAALPQTVADYLRAARPS